MELSKRNFQNGNIIQTLIKMLANMQICFIQEGVFENHMPLQVSKIVYPPDQGRGVYIKLTTLVNHINQKLEITFNYNMGKTLFSSNLQTFSRFLHEGNHKFQSFEYILSTSNRLNPNYTIMSYIIH